MRNSIITAEVHKDITPSFIEFHLLNTIADWDTGRVTRVKTQRGRRKSNGDLKPAELSHPFTLYLSSVWSNVSAEHVVQCLFHTVLSLRIKSQKYGEYLTSQTSHHREAVKFAGGSRLGSNSSLPDHPAF